MGKAQNYECKNCGKQTTVADEGAKPPECCEQDMAKIDLPVCESSSTAEHSRLDESLDPCDDGRSGTG